MQSAKFYATVAVVSALSDLAVNKYVSSRPAVGTASSGLKDFYSQVSVGKAMLLASVTIVSVVLIADFIYSSSIKK